MSELDPRALEAAAMTLQQHDINGDGCDWEEYLTDARAAVTAYLEASEQPICQGPAIAPLPGGGEESRDEFVLVPREATEAMHIAGMNERKMQDNLNKAHHVIIDTSAIYRAMINAAPPAAQDPRP